MTGPWEGLNPPYATIIVADPPWPFVWSGGPGGWDHWGHGYESGAA